MALDPQLERIRAERIAAGARPLHELTVEQARAADLAELRARLGAPDPVARVTDTEIPGPAGPIATRLFAPDDAPPLPALLFFPGGGWVVGTIEGSDDLCRRLANTAGCAVVAVAYRRAPEHRFPAAVEDCWAATAHIAGHAAELGLDERRIAVGGASAGGNLAAVIARLAHERHGPALAFQLLIYPVCDHRSDTPSKRAFTDPCFFGARDLDWVWRQYLHDGADGADPLASPLRARDLGGLPDALVITAEHDPVRDEAEAYARRLAAAGVRVEQTRYAGTVHGFVGMGPRLDAARAAVQEAGAALRAALA